MSAEDSADYLRHRLKLAGCERELFPQDAVQLLHEASEGAHRREGVKGLESAIWGGGHQ